MPKLVGPTVKKNCSNDREKHQKFKNLKKIRSLEQLVQTVKGQTLFELEKIIGI